MPNILTSSVTPSVSITYCNKKPDIISPVFSYRADIDGLRGLSIFFVLLYHLFPETFVGGFIGVDIFFVISGFLISNIIFKKLEFDCFSFLDFYSRRIKRIFPALIITCVLCLSYGWFVLLPDEFMYLAKHIGSASIFLTNFTLCRESGYFDFSSEAKPLLHLWSLAVEEQFYLLWPLFLWVIHKLKPKKNFIISHRSIIFSLIALITIFSFLMHLYFYQFRPNLAFYFTGARLWEMSIGSLGAYYALFLRNNPSSKFSFNWISSFSLVSILLSILFLKNTCQCFEFLIIIPVICSLLLLLNFDGDFINKKILSHPALVSLGLISYVVYLSHWPCISFLKIISGHSLTLVQKGFVFFFVVAFSVIVYKYVEIPIRKSTSNTLVIKLIVLMGILGASGYMGYQSIFKPKINYIFPRSQQITKAFNDWQYPTSKMSPLTFQGENFFKIGKTKNIVLFFGDSNIEQYAPRIEMLVVSNENKKSAVFATMGGLCPIPNVGRSEKEIAFVKNVAEYAYTEEVKEIVISGQWFSYLSGNLKNYHYRSEENNGNLAIQSSLNLAIKDLENFIARLISQGKKVYIVSSIPSGFAYNPKSFFERDFFGNWKFSPKHAEKKHWDMLNSKANSTLKNIAKHTSAIIINPEDFLCNERICYTYHTDGIPLYKDEGHINATYAKENIMFLDFLFK